MSGAILEVRDLRLEFRSPSGDSLPVLDIPRLEIQSGAEVAIHGPSGSGKSTLLHVISGLLRPSSGRVVVDGRDISAMSESARDLHRAATIGYVFQTFHLLPAFTALENVRVAALLAGKDDDRKRAQRALDSVGLGDRLDHLPSALSSGQQQRVAVARALVNAPRLVLADEPTGSLDPERAEEAVEFLRRSCRESGAALLVVSHDRELIARFGDVRDFCALNRAAAPADGARP